MRNFFLIKHHPRGLTEAYQENSCRTRAPRHTLPAFAGRHDDENLISLMRPRSQHLRPFKAVRTCWFVKEGRCLTNLPF